MTPPFENPESDPDQVHDDSHKATAHPGYALGRIAAALTTSEQHPNPETRQRAQTKIANWLQVFQGMLSGVLQVGSRTPVAQVPAWATLEVVQGGFATGRLLAEGPLQPHEGGLLARIGTTVPSGTPQISARAQFNQYYLSEAGMVELQEMLRTGNYRIEVPEEGALLIVAWLLNHDQEDAARRVLEEIAPQLHRLRFYPIPAKQADREDGVRVQLQPVWQTIEGLQAVHPPLAYRKQRESNLIWAPLSDRFVELFLETMEGATPFVRVGQDGESLVYGGYPCQHYSEDWRKRGRALLEEYRRLR